MLLDHERSRIAALKQYDVLDTPREDAFDRMAGMTARLFNADMTCITLVDRERYFFKSTVGLDATELDRQPGFCDTTIQSGNVHCIEDTGSDPLVWNHPIVCNAPYVRSYAGAPLTTSDGFVIGTLCMMNTAPRRFSESDRALLRELADFAMFQLDSRRLQLEMERRKDEASNTQKLESLGLLAGGIAHDFNNILVGVLGNASLAASQMAVDSPARESVHSIVRSANQAKELTDQLLSYAGQRPLSVRSVDLSVLVCEMSPLVRTSIAKNTTLEVDCDAGTPPVSGDCSQLRQVLLNLITNASEAYEKSVGTIKVKLSSARISEADSANTRFGDLHAGDYVLVEVIDCGCGMNEKTLGGLFDPFYTTKQTGRGLGMSIVQRIVRGHGGIIQVDSSPKQGTKVSVYLPAAPAEQAEDLSVARNERSGGSTGSVLVVDDEDVVIDMAESAIRHLGYDVIGVSSGAEALKLVASDANIRALVLDATLSGMSGSETLDQVRSRQPKLPTVITSGHHVDEVACEFRDFDNLTFLQKPWTIDALAEALNEALSKA